MHDVVLSKAMLIILKVNYVIISADEVTTIDVQYPHIYDVKLGNMFHFCSHLKRLKWMQTLTTLRVSSWMLCANMV